MELLAITRNPEVWHFKSAPSTVEKQADWSIATASLEELQDEALSLFADQNFAELIPVLSEMESQGSAWGAHYLAGCYSLGHGVEVDAERANELMRGAADLGLVESQTVLGRNLLVGDGAQKDVAEGLRYLNMAAAQGSAFAIYLLGEDSLSGSCETPQDPVAAAKLFQQSVDLGEHRAMQRLAWLYSNGLGVELDLAEALRLNMASAELGNEAAAFNAGRAFERGLGTVVDRGSALRFYEMAVQGNVVMAMHNLGALLFNGVGVEKDVEKAFHWYLKAANFGSGLSSLCLAQMYEAGDRGDVDLPMAATWYLISIAQSDNDAQARFDSIRAQLSDVEKQATLSIVTAFAEKGFHWGQLALSNLYASGIFCAQDELQSEKWAAAAECSKADADVMFRQM